MGVNEIKLPTLEELQGHQVAYNNFSQWQVKVPGWFKLLWHCKLGRYNSKFFLYLNGYYGQPKPPFLLFVDNTSSLVEAKRGTTM
jgi:hypothetical protein